MSPLQQSIMSPECHSTVGQKLLHVDWKMCDVDITCPHCRNGLLHDDRTNFSKNKSLFPTFVIDGPPMWAMVVSVTCSRCRHRAPASAGEALSVLPACARSACPVETEHAPNKNSHLSVGATTVFDLLVPTCGNGDLCSRLLCHATNRLHSERVEDCCSFCNGQQQQEEKEGPTKCTDLHDCHVRACPPAGDGVRDACDAACSNSNAPWQLSDHDQPGAPM